MLANVLAAAKPGDRILVSLPRRCRCRRAAGTEATSTYTQPRSVGRLIESKGRSSYGAYLKWRQILPTEPPRRPDPDRPGAPPMLRAAAWKYGFVGSPLHRLRHTATCRRSWSA